MAVQELTNFRQKYPDYNDLSDADLAGMLAKKYPDAYGDLPAKVHAPSDPRADFIKYQREHGGSLVDTANASPQETEQLRRQFVDREAAGLDEGSFSRLKEKAKIYAEDYLPSRQTIATLSRLVLEGSGAVAGGIIGAGGGTLTAPGPGTVAGGVLGAGLGYGIGARTADLIEGKSRTLTDSATQSLNDIATGATMEMGGQSAGKLLSDVTAPIVNRATPYVQKAIDSAKRLNIGLTPAEEMSSKPLSLVESVLGKMPGSSGIMQETQQAQQQGVQAAKQSLTDTLGTTAETSENIGAAVKEGLAGKSQQFTAKAGELYDKAASLIPEGTQIPTTNLANKAGELLDKLSKMPESFQDHHDLMPKLQELAVDTESLTYDGLKGLRSQFADAIRANDAAAKAGQPGVKGMGNANSGIYKQLKSALESDLQAYADTTGGQFKDAFDVANAFYREGKQLYNAPIIRRVMKSNPETVINMVMRPNSATDVKLLREAVGPEAFQTAKEAFTTKLLADEQNGLFSVAKFANKLDKFDESTLQAIYTPDEIRALKDLASVKPVVQGAEKMAGNPSGTAQNMLSYAQVGTAGGLVINGIMTGDPKKIAEGAAVMFAPAGIAKLYLSPIGRQYLTGAFKASPSAQTAAYIATKLIGIAGVENLHSRGAANAERQP